MAARVYSQNQVACPDIGPICLVRDEPPQLQKTTVWVTELRLLAEYGLISGLGVQGVLPLKLVDRRTVRSDLSGNQLTLDYEDIHQPDRTIAGLGDAQLYLHGALAPLGLQLGWRAGVSFPLGEVGPNPEEREAHGLTHEHVQFGTGTFDPVLGMDLSRSFGSWSLAGFAHAQVPIYRGAQGYQAGSRILGGLTMSYEHDAATVRLGTAGVFQAAESWGGHSEHGGSSHAAHEDGAERTFALAGPGVTFPLGRDWSVSADLRARLGGRFPGERGVPLLFELSIGRLVHMESDYESAHHMRADVGPAPDVEDIVEAGEERPLVGVPGKWTVFDFWAPWCEACKVLDGELRELAARNSGVAVRRVNIVDFESPIARRELPGVSLLPRVRLVDPQGKPIFEDSDTPDELMRELERRLLVQVAPGE